MILKVFTVFDRKTALYSQPYLFVSLGECLRAFGYLAAMDTASSFHRHGEDFTLFETGVFDNCSGLFQPLSDSSSGFVSHGTLLALGASYLGLIDDNPSKKDFLNKVSGNNVSDISKS